MSTLDQLVANLAAKRQVYLAAERVKANAKTEWDAALASCGLSSGVSFNLSNAPSPMPNFTALATALITALLAEKVAASDFNAARAAHSTALIAAGAQ